MHFDLIISQIRIHECQALITHSGIHQLVSVGYWKSSLTQLYLDPRSLCILNLSVLLFDKNYVSQPCGICTCLIKATLMSFPTFDSTLGARSRCIRLGRCFTNNLSTLTDGRCMETYRLRTVISFFVQETTTLFIVIKLI